ncbi:MAG: porin [Flavobacteriales bacterium]|nr:porin [Flavobacteriales bacterium]
MKKNLCNTILVLLVTHLSVALNAQDWTSVPFGKGLINVYSQDSSWSAKISSRIQTRYDGLYVYTTDTAFKDDPFHDRAYVRRARIKGEGHAYSPKVKYKFEYDVLSGTVLDAVVKWNFVGNLSVWFGQTKLPGNVERVISSQKLQFVDRSMLNSKFNIDRDAGIQFRHHMKLGPMLIREALAITQGEGLNQKGFSSGHCYTGRIELLPMGEFTKKGDYYASDLAREAKPKIMLGFTYSYNVNAERTGGQLGSYTVNGMRDLQTIFADLVIKYKGISVMVEYADRQTNGTPITAGTWDSEGVLLSVDEAFLTGTALNAQLGYLFKSNWELAARYTQFNPNISLVADDATEYTFGISRYVVGHNLKVQADFTWIQEENNYDNMEVRLQTEFSF